MARVVIGLLLSAAWLCVQVTVPSVPAHVNANLMGR